jgi:hypothetical protein
MILSHKHLGQLTSGLSLRMQNSSILLHLHSSGHDFLQSQNWDSNTGSRNGKAYPIIYGPDTEATCPSYSHCNCKSQVIWSQPLQEKVRHLLLYSKLEHGEIHLTVDMQSRLEILCCIVLLCPFCACHLPPSLPGCYRHIHVLIRRRAVGFFTQERLHTVINHTPRARSFTYP